MKSIRPIQIFVGVIFLMTSGWGCSGSSKKTEPSDDTGTTKPSIRKMASKRVNDRLNPEMLMGPPLDLRPKKTLTTAELSRQMERCLLAVTEKDEKVLKSCYDDGAVAMQPFADTKFEGPESIVSKLYRPAWVAFPDLKGGTELVLVHGREVVVMSWGIGTNTERLRGLAPTKKAVGVRSLKFWTFTAEGRIRSDISFSDRFTVLGQLGLHSGPHRAAIRKPPASKGTIVAANSDKERINLGVVQLAADAWNQHDLPRYLGYLAPNMVLHDMTRPDDIVGLDAIEQNAVEVLAAFPDTKTTLLRTWAAGDYVVSVAELSGTNSGALPSTGLKATGRKFRVLAGVIDRIENGKIVEEWLYWDLRSLSEQLGLMR
ncbi:MAG: hypothetical protein CMH54_05095 [Myxococcales bacterium]|nr:hypothetical protein [Myxococcales bacterium]